MEGRGRDRGGAERSNALRRRVVLARVDPRPTASTPMPPTSLAALAEAVRDCVEPDGIEVALVDRTIDRWGEADTARRLVECDPRVVVLGTGHATTPGAAPSDARALAGVGRRLESEGRAGPFRIGLVDGTKDAEWILREDGADVVLRGEADETLPAVVAQALAGRSSWDGTRGASWRCPKRGVRHEVDAPPPRAPRAAAWDLVELDRYVGERRGLTALRRPRRTATIVTSRVCEPTCKTCHGSFGPSSRDRSVRDVIAEVRALVRKRGVRTLRIADVAFDGRPERALEIANGIATLRSAPGHGGLRVEFPLGLRGDGLDAELVEALVRAGVRRFPLRIDTASPRLQRLTKRNVRIDRAARALEEIAAAGALGHLDLRIGLPTETLDEARQTVRWARASAAHTARFGDGGEILLGEEPSNEEHRGAIDGLRRRALRYFYSSPRRGALLARQLARSTRQAVAAGDSDRR